MSYSQFREVVNTFLDCVNSLPKLCLSSVNSSFFSSNGGLLRIILDIKMLFVSQCRKIEKGEPYRLMSDLKESIKSEITTLKKTFEQFGKQCISEFNETKGITQEKYVEMFESLEKMCEQRIKTPKENIPIPHQINKYLQEIAKGIDKKLGIIEDVMPVLEVAAGSLLSQGFRTELNIKPSRESDQGKIFVGQDFSVELNGFCGRDVQIHKVIINSLPMQALQTVLSNKEKFVDKMRGKICLRHYVEPIQIKSFQEPQTIIRYDFKRPPEEQSFKFFVGLEGEIIIKDRGFPFISYLGPLVLYRDSSAQKAGAILKKILYTVNNHRKRFELFQFLLI